MSIDEYIALIARGDIPPVAPDPLYSNDFRLRGVGEVDAFCELGHRYLLFAVVSMDWVSQLATWINRRRCLEIMAGRGYLAKALRACRVDICATDEFTWHWGSGVSNKEPVTEVLKMDALTAVSTHGKDADILIVSWPPYDETTIMDACSLWGTKPIVYIGEGHGGCCATDEFFEHLEPIPDAPDIFLPGWYCLHDHISIVRWHE